MVLDFLAVDNFDFTRKIVKKFLDVKFVKMLGFCQNSNISLMRLFNVNFKHCVMRTCFGIGQKKKQ